MGITKREKAKCDRIMDSYVRGRKLLDRPKNLDIDAPAYQSINVAAFTAMAMDLAKVLKVPLKKNVAATVVVAILSSKFAGKRVGSKFVIYNKTAWVDTFLRVARLCFDVANYILHQRD